MQNVRDVERHYNLKALKLANKYLNYKFNENIRRDITSITLKLKISNKENAL